MDRFKENDIIGLLKRGLKKDGWNVREHVKLQGGFVDLLAEKDGTSFAIEACGIDKGGFISAENAFQLGLGRLLARMTDPDMRYAIAIPESQEFFLPLKKYQNSFAFKALALYIFVATSNNSCIVVPPTDIASFIEHSCG